MLILLVIGAYLCCSLALWAQSPSSAVGDATSQTTTVDPQSSNINSTRTIESHTQSGNRTMDNQSIQLRDSDGNFQPFRDIEKQTVKVNATTVRTTTRTFGRDSDGAKTLVQVTEEEKHSLPGGDSSVISATSNPDADGRLQLVQREIQETKKISNSLEETKTTVMLPGISGDLAPATQVQERRQKEGNNTIESQKTTLLPDGNGGWQVGEVQRTTIRQDDEGKNRSADESISRSDLDGNLDEVSRTVSKESEIAPGETRKTVEIYSLDSPGTAREGGLQPVERKTTTQRSNSAGGETIEQQVEKPVPGDPDSDLRVTTVTIDKTRPTSAGSRATRTIQSSDADGNLGVVSVDTTDTRGTSAVLVQIAPSEKPK